MAVIAVDLVGAEEQYNSGAILQVTLVTLGIVTCKHQLPSTIIGPS